MAIRFHLDEHVDGAVAVGLRRRNIDVTTTAQAGLLGAADERHLSWALTAGRVVFTHDPDFLRLADAGALHSGIIFAKQRFPSIGQIIEHLELIFLCMSEDEMRNHVEFL